MADLGTITAKRSRHVRMAGYSQLTALNARAHYPVRLAGRDTPFQAGASPWHFWPWAAAPQPRTDQYGARYYHPHRVEIMWPAALGARQLSVLVRHNFTAPPYPILSIDPDPAAGVAAQSAVCPATPNQSHTLTLSLTTTAPRTLRATLSCANRQHDAWTTWGDITAT